MTDCQQTVQSSDFKGRKTGLVIFGILEIVLGGICALMVPLMILSMIRFTAKSMNASMMIPGLLFYVLIAVWFVSMGIGSVRARRWARALLLVSSWVWIISGLGGLVFMSVLMPDVYGQMVKTGQMPQKMAHIMQYVMIASMAFIYVVIPGVLILFYRNKNVKAACEFRNPRASWTDECPLPVLAVSLIFAVWAFSMLFMGFYGWAIPFFGSILGGVRGAGAAVVAMLALAYVAWGTYKLDIKAWWGSVLLTVAWALSTGITFSRVSLWDFYAKMNFPEQQLQIMKQCMPQPSTFVLYCGIWFVGFLGYLLYTKRYFRLPSEQVNAS